MGPLEGHGVDSPPEGKRWVLLFVFSSFSYANNGAAEKENFKLYDKEFSRAWNSFLLIIISPVTIWQTVTGVLRPL